MDFALRSSASACERAGISGLTFHDLRGTAVVRLAIAGASVPKIAAVSGYSLKDVDAILDTDHLGRDIQLAEAAVLRLEARTKLVNGAVNGRAHQDCCFPS